MFIKCGSSQTGESHKIKGTICQDSCYFVESNGYLVAAVADGLGSSKHSDVASNKAVKIAVNYFISKIRKNDKPTEILSIIKKSFGEANFKIKQESNDAPDDYDTTLSMAVFINGKVFYGNAGDSGIVALCSNGKFERVTTPANAEGYGKEAPVYPLAAESKWVFGEFTNKSHALFLMTDGIWNKIVPPLLKEQEYELDIAYLTYLYTNLMKNIKNAQQWIEKEINEIAAQDVNYDDKTLLGLIDTSIRFSKQSKEYYGFPSSSLWNNLFKKHRDILYPYRCKEETSQLTQEIQNPAHRQTILEVKQVTAEKAKSVDIENTTTEANSTPVT